MSICITRPRDRSTPASRWPGEVEVIGTSNTDGEIAVVGVSGSLIVTITGQVTINERTGAISIEGSYAIKTASGKLFDSGIIARF
jgi:hypothetical protein